MAPPAITGAPSAIYVSASEEMRGAAKRTGPAVQAAGTLAGPDGQNGSWLLMTRVNLSGSGEMFPELGAGAARTDSTECTS
jgi:hypothetical protein